jgi:trans-aconitate methyltransferase
LEDFLQTGEQDIAHVMRVIEESGTVLNRGIAIDFGCGVGRLTQPLASRFALAIGIDISPTMIEAAAQYLLNTLDDHSTIPDHSAGLVFSRITLQHMPPAHARALHS